MSEDQSRPDVDYETVDEGAGGVPADEGVDPAVDVADVEEVEDAESE